MLSRRSLLAMSAAAGLAAVTRAGSPTAAETADDGQGSGEAMPKHAYDIGILHSSIGEADPRGQGWCYGLPPGIAPEQWPLDPNSGYPLQHGFTILLPEDYRIHGPEIVALSFFAIAFDHNDGAPAEAEEIPAVFRSFPGEGPPEDPELAVFWHAEAARHPRTFRMQDILDCEYAVILLTREEFDGPFCMPPRVEPNRYRDSIARPRWMGAGAAAAYWGYEGTPLGPVEETYMFKVLGEVPWKGLAYNRALSWTPRGQDPNAGISPRDEYEVERTGYQPHYYWEGGILEVEKYREHEWAKDHKPDHIGGTMRPAQGIPPFSPYYIGFEEYLGGYNFGSGNAQLDFRDMKFDWAQ